MWAGPVSTESVNERHCFCEHAGVAADGDLPLAKDDKQPSVSAPDERLLARQERDVLPNTSPNFRARALSSLGVWLPARGCAQGGSRARRP